MVRGDQCLKITLVQQKTTAPGMSEEMEREANENIQIHVAVQEVGAKMAAFMSRHADLAQ